MTLEEMSNLQLLRAFANAIRTLDESLALELREEIFLRMEGE